MRNKITIEFDSIDFNEARTFYNVVIDYSKNKSGKFLITRIQTKLDCNVLKKSRVEQLEIKYDLITKELQNLNIWRRKHLKIHLEKGI